MTDTKRNSEGCDSLVEITPQMVAAGVDVLSHWKDESDYVSEQQAVKEIFEAMVACKGR